MRERDVYEIWSQDGKQVYVGLSVNSKKRAGQHKHSKTAGGLLNSGGTMKTVASALQQSDAVEMERNLIAKYRSDPRVKCLNRRAGGQLGSDGGLVWTKEKVYDIAKGCETRADLYYKSGSAYHAARRDGYLDELAAEFGFAESIHKIDGNRVAELEEKWRRCDNIFHLRHEDRRAIFRRGLLRKFSGLGVISLSNPPDDLRERIKYFPSRYCTNGVVWWYPKVSSYGGWASDELGTLRYYGEVSEMCRKLKAARTKEFCEATGLYCINDYVEKEHVYSKNHVMYQKNFPEGFTTLELLGRYPQRYLRSPRWFRNEILIMDFVRKNSEPVVVEKAISDGKLPMPTHHHSTGALFPIKSMAQWALDTPSEACYP